MRGFHTAALFAVVSLALCAGGAADTNTPQARGTGASNIGTADARLSLDITTAAERPQGSDADELTRGRRPNWGGKWKNSYRDEHHGNKKKPNKQKPTPPRHEEPEWCEANVYCDTDLECHEKYPCQKTHCKTSHKFKGKNWQKKGKCVCFENKPEYTPCIGDEDVCEGPLGQCDDAGVCIPQPRDNGCPCAGEPDNESCLYGLDANENACLNQLQKCKCGGDGTCVPNYLPKDTACYRDDLGACEVAKCNAEGKCEKTHADADTPCIGDEDVCEGPLGQCDDAGMCVTQPDDNGCPCTNECTPPTDACVDPDFPCICDSGACVVNYLPPGGPCVPSTKTAVDVCEETICVIQTSSVRGTTPDEVVCKKEDRPNDTACFADFGVTVGSNPPDSTCDNAGVCEQGVCQNLSCRLEEAKTCKEKLPNDEFIGCTVKSCGTGNAECDQACSDATDGLATCIGTTPFSCNCFAPGGQDQFNCKLTGGGDPLGQGKSRCCVCMTPEIKQ